MGAGGNSALPGRVFTELLTPARRAGLSSQFAGLFGNEAKILKLESELVRLDGETRPVELAARAFPWDHQPAVQIILRDLTEKKKFEEQFLRAQRLQSLGCLAGGIAHDLNNVLTPILAATDILGASAKDADDRRIIEVVDASARRGADIVKQILAFARGGKGEREPLQIRYVVGEIEKILTDALPRNIELQKSILPEAVLIEGDPTQLHQVLMNLCINARDAMPQGGQLKITATNIVLLENQARQIDGASPGAWLRLTVSDTGTGMTAEVLNRLFEPFFTTKAPGKGTGLGLATVQNIVKSHGGFLTVESIPGRGSHFHIHLPAASAPEVDVTAEMSPEILPQGRGELVLVADDEAAILEITKATLEFHGYRVLTARDGADAVALFCRHQHEIDLFLTDVNMPYLDGPGAIRAVETLNSRKQVRYVMMSGGPAGLNENELPAELPVRFLAKPFTAKALLGAFDESLHLAEAA